MINIFCKGVETLSKLCGIAAAIMLLMAVAVVCQMVVVRYFLEASSYWQTEFVTYILIGSTFIGAPYVLMTRGHVNVELIPMKLGPRPRFLLALLAYSVAAAFCITITWLGAEEWYLAWSRNWLSDSVWAPPLWIPYLAMPIGFGILSLQYIVDILSLVTGRHAPFGLPMEELED
jgi:TRAP-type C4-dicarboxylate transport system permease small subunit